MCYDACRCKDESVFHIRKEAWHHIDLINWRHPFSQLNYLAVTAYPRMSAACPAVGSDRGTVFQFHGSESERCSHVY
jgi:hypothetical protein